MDTTARYSAFISYSHTDSKWAEWLQRAIETYRLPGSLCRNTGLPAKLKKVFRDRDELAMGQNLGEHLQAALNASDALIVVCSPASRDSKWVNQEIDHFKSLGKGHRIFCLLVEGDGKSFAPPLLQDIDGNTLEPLAADPRETADGKTRAKLKIIASILDLNLDDLARREAIRRRQRMSFVLAGVAAVLAVTIWGVINQQARQAQIEVNLTSATATADYIDSRRENLDMTSLGFASDLLQNFIDNVGEVDRLNPDQATALAKLNRTQGLALYDLGDPKKAISLLKLSRDSLNSLFEIESNNVARGIEAALSEYYLASVYLYDRKFDKATPHMRAYVAITKTLFSMHSTNQIVSNEAVFAPAAMLKLLIESDAEKQKIESAILQARIASDKGLDRDPENPDLFVSKAMLADDIANYYMTFCDVLASVSEREAALATLNESGVNKSDNRLYLTHVSNAHLALAGMYLTQAAPSSSVAAYLQANEKIEYLRASDPNNNYLAEKQFRWILDLTSVASFHPELKVASPAVRNALPTLNSAEFTQQATKYGKEALLTLRRAHYALSIEDWAEAEQQSRILGEMTAEDMTGKGREYYRVFYLLQQRLLSAKLGTSQNSIDMPMDDEAAQEILTDQSCPARFYQWATYVLNDDSDAANSVAAEAWNLGLRGKEIAFYARLLDIEHPPKGTVY